MSAGMITSLMGSELDLKAFEIEEHRDNDDEEENVQTDEKDQEESDDEDDGPEDHVKI